ncbi:hypothetical protein GJ744_009328 [Endocarpon pusillum]|uniref:Carboxypeptidase Y inhibitor n=1 Tax=Endocarpon pusillum TaxID=364733 RepID=A0A8H7AI67_9EURO|nr:hypothetical protein GJ744_009328 [Endocarpon pusillum]
MHLLHYSIILPLSLSQYVSSSPFARTQQITLSGSTGTVSSIRDALKYSSVIPDVLDDFEATYSVSITYPKSHESVQLGNDIPVNPGSSHQSFTLILTDPDAKSRDNPKWSEMCHWIMTNLTAPVTSATEVSMKSELVEYLPPTPPPKTGKHRYVFVLLEGQQGQALSTPKDRKHWGYGKKRHGVRDWAEENGLSVVGANFFFAEDEEQ